jgi:hypothetical protein
LPTPETPDPPAWGGLPDVSQNHVLEPERRARYTFSTESCVREGIWHLSRQRWSCGEPRSWQERNAAADDPIEKIYFRIEEALRNQYSIEYTPEPKGVSGQYRKYSR